MTRVYVVSIDAALGGAVVSADDGATYFVPATAKASVDGVPAMVRSLPGWFAGLGGGNSVSAELHFGGGVTSALFWSFWGGT